MEKYVPDMYQKSIYTIDYSKLLNAGIKCLLFDLDNTVVPSKSSEPSNKAKDLFISLKQKGFKVIIFSNSPKFRIKKFKNYFEVECICSAMKPWSYNFKKVMTNHRFTENEVAIIGDQIMTDVLGGNKVGITTILVNPLETKDFIWTKVNRFREKRIMKKLRKRDLFCKGRYYE